MFTISLMLSTFIVISSNSWFSAWIGLEINLLSMIPLMHQKKNMYSSEASIKYFITQAMASSILLLMIILMMHLSLNLNSNMLMMIMNSAILMKMGTAPFHFWFPEVMEGLNWNNCFIMLTWQKIAPMILIMYNINMIEFFSYIIIMCMIISGIQGINQISMRKILTYSSINHIGWMIASMFYIETMWWYYFIIYMLITLNLTYMFKILNIFYIKQLIMMLNNKILIKFFFMMNFLSLGGLPPFMGFFPKWLTIQNLIFSNNIMLPLMMTFLTLMTLFYYMQLIFSSLILNLSTLNFYLTNPNINNNMILFNFIMLMSLIFSTMMFNWL
uniref:NADH-ubiquinone oxidoreductase chain 2 n=1 Tax=Staphylinoidea sp. 12 KM-2017 TaxID=2219452 RepID=A0A346RFI7_9COLE|nr:NADH dehydrogenase subunit 2 [Staphylinoidea sp. 12 KM-2017]